MDLGIAGTQAMVCGASAGLGYACAQALVSEGVDVLIVARTEAPLQAAAEQLHALGGGQVQALAADIPTLAEQGIAGVVVTSWYGLLAPAGTPDALVEQLARDAAEILEQPAVREQLRAQGLSQATQKPAEFAAHIRAETQTWARIIRARGITAQ